MTKRANPDLANKNIGVSVEDGVSQVLENKRLDVLREVAETLHSLTSALLQPSTPQISISDCKFEGLDTGVEVKEAGYAYRNEPCCCKDDCDDGASKETSWTFEHSDAETSEVSKPYEAKDLHNAVIYGIPLEGFTQRDVDDLKSTIETFQRIYVVGDEDNGFFLGCSPVFMEDDETANDFRESVQKEIKDVVDVEAIQFDYCQFDYYAL